jgi:Rrf2 family protein
MKLSAKSRYGLKAMYYLAENIEDGKPLSLRVLAQFSGVSSPYLEKLLGILRRKELIRATRGVNGGYNLTALPKDITVGDVIRALEGDVLKVECVTGNCKNIDCPNRAIFGELYVEINNVLDKITLQNMLEQN